MTIASIILAAGKGTRMRSKLPKVLHPLAGKPMVWHAQQAVKGTTDLPPVLVEGYRAEAIREAMADSFQYVLHEEHLGAGPAMTCV